MQSVQFFFPLGTEAKKWRCCWPIHMTMIWYETKNIAFEIQRMQRRWFEQTINEYISLSFKSQATVASWSFNDRCAVVASDDQLNLSVDISWIWIFYMYVTWISRCEGRWWWWLVASGGFIMFNAKIISNWEMIRSFGFIYAKIISVCEEHI